MYSLSVLIYQYSSRMCGIVHIIQFRIRQDENMTGHASARLMNSSVAALWFSF